MLVDPCDPCDVIHDAKEVPVGIKIYARIHHLPIETQSDDRDLDRRIELELSNFGIHMTDNLAWYFDVTWWRQTCLASSREIENRNVKHWQDSYESYSIAFLDLENPEIDTNIVVLQYPQPEIETWREAWRHRVTQKCRALRAQFLKLFHWISRPQKPETIPIKLLYDFIQPEIQYMTLWRHVWRHHVTSKC